jgi:hypothetical protein
VSSAFAQCIHYLVIVAVATIKVKRNLNLWRNSQQDLILRERLALQRTILANQTTVLAFIRTAMYFCCWFEYQKSIENWKQSSNRSSFYRLHCYFNSGMWISSSKKMITENENTLEL